MHTMDSFLSMGDELVAQKTLWAEQLMNGVSMYESPGRRGVGAKGDFRKLTGMARWYLNGLNGMY